MNEPGSSQYKYSFNINTAINSAFGDNARVEVHYHSRESKNTSDLTREQVLAAFHRANAELRTYNNQIAGVHLARPEVAQIVDWALSANAQEKLGILIDQPGGGKTVVMRDILEELETRGVPVLAIKADWLTGVRNGDDLASRLGLPAAVEICAELLSSDGPCFFLIDQLDALSLALSRDQATLDVMMSLIARLREMSNVRVLTSCRIFDLHNDPRLSTIRPDCEFQLQPLPDDKIIQVLRAINITWESMLQSHKKLLQVPLHLYLYAQVIGSYIVGQQPERYNTLQELYRALWRRLVEL